MINKNKFLSNEDKMEEGEPIEIILGKEELELIDKIKAITGDADERGCQEG